FAVAEGHQEAVMWFSAIGELYMFLFGGASLALWLLACRPGSRWFLQAASAVLFALALLSKESAVIFLPLFLLAAPAECWESWKRSLVRLLPHLALAALAIASVAASRGSSFRFSDGSFSLHAPFWFTWPHGVARVLWGWGWIALAAILWFRTPSLRKPAFRALSWIGIALAPYSFLTYSRQIPSRQTYLASFGLALLVGLALAHLARGGCRGRAHRAAEQRRVPLDPKTGSIPGARRVDRTAHQAGPPNRGSHLGAMLSARALHCPGGRSHGGRPSAFDLDLERSRGRAAQAGRGLLLPGALGAQAFALLGGGMADEDERSHAESADRQTRDAVHPEHGALVEAVAKAVRQDRQHAPPQHRAQEDARYHQQRQPPLPVVAHPQSRQNREKRQNRGRVREVQEQRRHIFRVRGSLRLPLRR